MHNSALTHAVDPGDGDAGVEAGTVVRLGDVAAEGVLEPRRAVVGALVGFVVGCGGVVPVV